MPAAVFSIFTASTGFRPSYGLPVNGWPSGASVGSSLGAAVAAWGALPGAGSSEEEQAATGSSTAAPASVTVIIRDSRT